MTLHPFQGRPFHINPATKLTIPAAAESRNPEKALRLLDSRLRGNNKMAGIGLFIELPV